VSRAERGSSVVERNPPLVSVILEKSYSTKEANFAEAGRRGAGPDLPLSSSLEELRTFRASRRLRGETISLWERFAGVVGGLGRDWDWDWRSLTFSS